MKSRHHKNVCIINLISRGGQKPFKLIRLRISWYIVSWLGSRPFQPKFAKSHKRPYQFSLPASMCRRCVGIEQTNNSIQVYGRCHHPTDLFNLQYVQRVFDVPQLEKNFVVVSPKKLDDYTVDLSLFTAMIIRLKNI